MPVDRLARTDDGRHADDEEHQDRDEREVRVGEQRPDLRGPAAIAYGLGTIIVAVPPSTVTLIDGWIIDSPVTIPAAAMRMTSGRRARPSGRAPDGKTRPRIA